MKWAQLRTARIKKQLQRMIKRVYRRYAPTVLLMVILAGVIGILGYSMTRPVSIDSKAYQPLLDTIAKGESSGNYNAYFGNGNNASLRFTEMSVAEVLAWQERYVAEGSASSAVGKYQIIRSTLNGLVEQLNLDTSVRFDAALQDRLAITLLERRGSVAFVEQKISREQFAANLAKEWGALPRVIGDNPHESYYADDGLNQARISVNEIYGALAPLTRLQ